MRAIVITGMLLLMWGGVCFAEGEGKPRTLVAKNPPSSGRILSPQAQQPSLDHLKEGVFLKHHYAFQQEDDFFEMPGEFGERKEGWKSGTKAALLSLLLPGAGEIYGGSKTKGKIFIFSEASLWAGFFAFRTYGSWLKDDYKVYAASNARVDLDGKDDDFFDNLAFYDNRDQYNQFALLYNRGEKQPYPQDDVWNWEWDSRESREHYRDLKNRSKSAYRRALYMVGLSALNRIVSVVDAIKTVRAYNRKRSLEFSRIKFDLKANPLGHNPQVMVYISRRW
jgi:hypothetical protein